MRVTRELLKPHIHAGQELQPGAQISLLPGQAQWLDGLGVTGPPTAAAAPAPTEPEGDAVRRTTKKEKA
ncbi:DUF7210 family protein [Chitinimonas lacunae]|uniref:DUF7210 domain-containing protein n=1 Tax=Chitinimonas lacunae TaxID=1963018 RepID=A0ABV8MLZ7_9NEIS